MGSVFSGIASLLGLGGSLAAGSTQAGATHQAQGDIQQFTTAGQIANNEILSLLGFPNRPNTALYPLVPFQSSPGYQFQKQQGIDVIDNSAAARGGVVSGNTLKALDTFGTGLANQDFYNFLNQLRGVQSLGENAAVGVGNLATQGANATAAGIAGGTNALTSFLNNQAQIDFLNNFLQNGGGSGFPSAADNTVIGNALGLFPLGTS